MADIVSRFESAADALQTDQIGDISLIASQDNHKARDSQSDDDQKTIVRSTVNNNVSINSSRYKDDRPENGNESSNEDGDSDADRETKSIVSKSTTHKLFESNIKNNSNIFFSVLPFHLQFRLKSKRRMRRRGPLKIRMNQLKKTERIHLNQIELLDV